MGLAIMVALVIAVIVAVLALDVVGVGWALRRLRRSSWWRRTHH